MKFSRRSFVQIVSALPAMPAAAAQGLPEIECDFDAARAVVRGGELVVETGVVTRRWKATARGLVTAGLRNMRTGKEWAAHDPAAECDWSLDGFGIPEAEAKLIGLSARPVRFDPYTSDHLEVTAEYDYGKLRLRYAIWAYPGAPGLRTQVSAIGTAGAAGAKGTRLDYIPADCARNRRRAIGYYNDTQHRDLPETEILREEVKEGPAGESYDWANIVCLESGAEGLCMVKESHKCVNQPGVDTGGFECGATGLVSTGWGVGAADLAGGEFHKAWASWVVVFDGGDDGRELAIKTFDRRRYPVDARRDIYIMSNTWGSGATSEQSQEAAREENVLREIEVCRDLGIDVLEIDSGWQDSNTTWRPSPEKYPQGWGRVREAARRAGVKLGLWFAWTVGAEDLKRNQRLGGFPYFKIDYSRLTTYGAMEGLMRRVREAIEASGQTLRLNWDVTENAPRVGYYFAREFGNVYLENRKPEIPVNAVYVPYMVLRDAWQVAKYGNLDKFLLTIQKVDLVDRKRSDAFRYPQTYAVAMALMGTPLFFGEVHLYTPEQRAQIRPLVALYRKHRGAIYRGHTFPIGEKPSNRSWTGFQNHHAETGSGYLMVFRELGAAGSAKEIPLRFVRGKKIRLIDLRTGTERTVQVPADGRVRFEIAEAPGFGFYRYE